jgi:hypothetical protein
MPLVLLLLFTLITPLLGIIQVEQGSFAPSVNKWGSANGAWLAFSVYIVFVVAGAWLASGGRMFRKDPGAGRLPVTVTTFELRRFLDIALFVNASLLFLMLFVFGGMSVLAGSVGKGEFRAELGGYGAVAYLTLKWLSPSVFALGASLYVFAGRPRGTRWKLFLLGLLTFVIGASWGFKTSGLLVLVPAFTILMWFARLRALLLPGLCAAAVIYIAYNMFDALEGGGYEAAFRFLYARLTVWQGDVAWHIWGMWRDGEPFPNYLATLRVVIGDQLFSLLTGLTRDSGEQWVLTHFGSMLTYLAGNPIEHIVYGGHNVTGTPFSEGVIAMGAAGIPVFGMLAGLVCGFVYMKVYRAIQAGRPLASAIWSNYFCWCVFAWLNGGDIVQLFHISVIVGAIAAHMLLSVCMASAKLVRDSRAQAPTH